MEIKFNLTGADRKRLVTAMTEILNAPMHYMGAPTFGFEVGGYIIDHFGTVSAVEDTSLEVFRELFSKLRERGFEAETPAELGETDSLPEPIKTETIKTEPGTSDESMTIDFPLGGMTETAQDNLRKLIDSKSALIRKALGADNLTVEVTEQKLRFPWFSSIPQADEIYAYTVFISKLIDMANAQKRVTAGQREVENEKYAFRCFLLRLGFIGGEYKESRRTLLQNFSGSSAFKSGARAENLNESGGNEDDE